MILSIEFDILIMIGSFVWVCDAAECSNTNDSRSSRMCGRLREIVREREEQTEMNIQS